MVPSPVPAVLVKAAGSPPLQIVCAPAIAPAVGTLWTVTCSGAVGNDSQTVKSLVAKLPAVAMVTLLNCVVADNTGGLKVSPDSPEIVAQLGVVKSVLDSQR